MSLYRQCVGTLRFKGNTKGHDAAGAQMVACPQIAVVEASAASHAVAGWVESHERNHHDIGLDRLALWWTQDVEATRRKRIVVMPRLELHREDVGIGRRHRQRKSMTEGTRPSTEVRQVRFAVIGARHRNRRTDRKHKRCQVTSQSRLGPGAGGIGEAPTSGTPRSSESLSGFLFGHEASVGRADSRRWAGLWAHP